MHNGRLPTAERMPRVLAIAQADPFNRATWSGGSYHLFTAMRDMGALVGGVGGDPPRRFDQAIKVLSWSRSRDLRRQRAALHPLRRPVASALAWDRARRVDPRPDAIVQLGVFYDVSPFPGLSPRLRCSLHDANLATSLHRDGRPLAAAPARMRTLLRYERQAYDRMDVIFTTSEWLRQSFITDFDQAPDKVVTVGAGPNLDELPDAPRRAPGPPRFLFVGKDFPRKGGPEVVEAFARVRADFPEAELWLVGPTDAPSVPGVRNFGLISRSTPEGDERVRRIYREATAFVMPSRYEPFGFVFLEAMSFALPCVVADACAMPEIVHDGVTGHVVPRRDPGALAERMIALAADPQGAIAMGHAGRRRLEEQFSWKMAAERIVAAISVRLGHPEAPVPAPPDVLAVARA